MDKTLNISEDFFSDPEIYEFVKKINQNQFDFTLFSTHDWIDACHAAYELIEGNKFSEASKLTDLFIDNNVPEFTSVWCDYISKNDALALKYLEIGKNGRGFYAGECATFLAINNILKNKDKEEVIDLLELAINKKYPNAVVLLGYLYEGFWGFDYDFLKAINTYLISENIEGPWNDAAYGDIIENIPDTLNDKWPLTLHCFELTTNFIIQNINNALNNLSAKHLKTMTHVFEKVYDLIDSRVKKVNDFLESPDKDDCFFFYRHKVKHDPLDEKLYLLNHQINELETRLLKPSHVNSFASLKHSLNKAQKHSNTFMKICS